jgi:hypothetical protein
MQDPVHAHERTIVFICFTLLAVLLILLITEEPIASNALIHTAHKFT